MRGGDATFVCTRVAIKSGVGKRARCAGVLNAGDCVGVSFLQHRTGDILVSFLVRVAGNVIVVCDDTSTTHPEDDTCLTVVEGTDDIYTSRGCVLRATFRTFFKIKLAMSSNTYR